jgi:6-phosphogluconolactonase (cycloisomerase 2 family)
MLIADGQFLYVPMPGFSGVAGYTIGSDNSLTQISGSPFSAAAGGDTVVTDSAGRFLFVGGQFSSSISVYQISPTTGILTPTPGSPFRSFDLGISANLTVDGNGKFLYVGQSFSTSPVVAFSINQTNGALTEISGSPFTLGVSVLQADPNGNFLLGIADNTGTSGDKHISVFSINQTTGAPTAVSGSPFATVSVPFALAVHPSGSFVYASVADSTGAVTALEGYQLSAAGALTALSGSPFTAFPFADCQFEQSGAFDFCPNATGFSVLGVDTTTGALSLAPPALTTTNNFPFAVTD